MDQKVLNNMKKGNINVSVENIFPLIKKFLYSDHEIFLRELISNATDATLKLKHIASIGKEKIDVGEIVFVKNVFISKENDTPIKIHNFLQNSNITVIDSFVHFDHAISKLVKVLKLFFANAIIALSCMLLHLDILTCWRLWQFDASAKMTSLVTYSHARVLKDSKFGHFLIKLINVFVLQSSHQLKSNFFICCYFCIDLHIGFMA